MQWCGWNRWRRKAPLWLRGKSHLCEHVCACHEDDDNEDKSYCCDSWDKTTWLQFVSARLTPVGKSTEEKPFISLNSEPKYQVQKGFCWFEHLWAPLLSHATKYDSCLSPIQSSQLLGQMNNEQWCRLFFCKFRGYYLRQNIRKRESRSKSVSKDISRLEFNPPWLLCLPKHWNREYENLKRILGLI